MSRFYYETLSKTVHCIPRGGGGRVRGESKGGGNPKGNGFSNPLNHGQECPCPRAGTCAFELRRNEGVRVADALIPRDLSDKRAIVLVGIYGIIQGMRAVKSRPEITVRKRVLSDSEVRFDRPVPGTMAERIGMVWPLTAEIVSIGGRLDAERRLQRHVAVLSRGRR